MNVDRLVRTIQTVPHLDLLKHYDLEHMREEISRVPFDQFQSYRTNIPEIEQMIGNTWKGFSLYSPDGHLHSDLTENGDAHGHVCLPTAMVERLPYITSIVEDLGGYDPTKRRGTRVRVMAVMPGGRLTWHSHLIDRTGVDPFYPSSIVVHVPIFSPEDFRYEVIPIQDMRLCDHLNQRMRIYSQNYECGRATLFNSFHYHNVFNGSRDKVRVSLMLYLDLSYEKTFAIVDRALSEYKGEFIA